MFSKVFGKLLFAVAYGLLFSVLAYMAAQVNFSNGDWFTKDNIHQQNIDFLNSTYESDKKQLFIYIDLVEQQLVTIEVIDELRRLTASIAAIGQVDNVLTPINARVFQSGDNGIEFKSLEGMIDRENLPVSLNQYRTALVESIYFNKLVAKDFRSFLVVVDINTLGWIEDYDSLTEKIDGIIEEFPGFSRYYYSGPNYIKQKINHDSAESIAFIIAGTLLLLALVTFIIHRRVLYTVIVLFTVINALILTLSVFALLGYDITTLSTILLALILVIAFSDSLYILNAWCGARMKREPVLAIVFRQTVRATWKPCLITSITTAVGFSSFYFSEIYPLQQLAVVAVLAVMGSYLIITLTTWYSLFLFDAGSGRQVSGQSNAENNVDVKPSLIQWVDSALTGVYCFCTVQKRSVVLFSAGAGFLCAIIFLVNGLKFESNTLDEFLKSSDSSHAGFFSINRDMYIFNNVDLILDSRQSEYFKGIEQYQSVMSLVAVIDEIDMVEKVESFVDIPGMLHREMSPIGGYPNTQEELSQELLFIEFMSSSEIDDLLYPYMDFDYSAARIHINLQRHLNYRESAELIEKLYLLATQHTGISALITGRQMYDYNLSKVIVTSQLQSMLFITTALIILFVVMFGYRLGLLASLANTLPFIIVAGTMSVANIEFDFAAVLAFCVSFGLIVDMGVHAMHGFQLHDGQKNPVAGVKAIICSVGKPLSQIIVALMGCYLLFIGSDIFVLSKFGWLSAFILLSAVPINLLFVPALILLVSTLKQSRMKAAALSHSVLSARGTQKLI